jgi:hypothetical protein
LLPAISTVRLRFADISKTFLETEAQVAKWFFSISISLVQSAMLFPFHSGKEGPMHSGRIVFSQILDFMPRYEFNKCVQRYQGNYRIRKLSCCDQFLCMAFAQLTYRESLRDIETCLRALQKKLYHAGLRNPIARSTLAEANENRDWRIYADLAQILIQRARLLSSPNPLDMEKLT